MELFLIVLVVVCLLAFFFIRDRAAEVENSSDDESASLDGTVPEGDKYRQQSETLSEEPKESFDAPESGFWKSGKSRVLVWSLCSLICGILFDRFALQRDDFVIQTQPGSGPYGAGAAAFRINRRTGETWQLRGQQWTRIYDNR